MKPGLQTAQSPSVEKKRGEASGAERGSSAASLQRHIFSSRVVSFVFPMAEDPTRFDKFLEGIRGYLGQRDRIRTRLLSADPIIESVETLQNVVRNRTVESATALLERNLVLSELDASALVGLLAAYQARLDQQQSEFEKVKSQVALGSHPHAPPEMTLSGDGWGRTAWGMESDQKLRFDELSVYHRRDQKMNSIYRPTYKRLLFTTPPVFGDEFIVGNLNEIVLGIETHILESMKRNSNIKENYPFHCVINPPRHGKSLLLDRLFLNDDKVVVIAVTYNSTSGLIKGELDNAETAMRWFWMRVLKSMLQISDPLDSLSHHLLQPEQCSWPHIKSLIINGLSSNPFIDEDGNQKNILFCIDEFSVITDKLQNWDRDQQKVFISKLHQIKLATHPFTQFVMTGFHSDMETLLESSSNIACYTLELCDFSTSRPLLYRILEEYQNSTQSGKMIPFPLSLFEAVKSTPGLIGFWAELVHRQIYCRDISDFSRQMPWLQNVTKDDERLKTNWLLIFRYLVFLIQDDICGLTVIGKEIVAAEIGISYPTPEIIPLCFVLITSLASFKKVGENPLQNMILDKLKELFIVIETIDVKDESKNGDEGKNGKPFEMLTITALHIRLLLRVEILFGGDDPDKIVGISFRSFFPIPSSESFSGKIPQLESTFSVHLIRTKESLRKFLIPPLYNIFPLGIKSLEGVWDQNNRSSLIALINTKREDYQLTAPSQYDHLMYISSKSPPKKNQSVICRVKHTISAELVLQLFNRMKGGESPEAINQTLTGDDKDWWNRLKTLTIQLNSSITQKHSLISTAGGAEGVDLLIAWKELAPDATLSGEDDYVTVADKVIHIAAVELKDQRHTPLKSWIDKWNSLMSPFCILHWMPLFFPDCTFSIHFIFAGREHSTIS